MRNLLIILIGAFAVVSFLATLVIGLPALLFGIEAMTHGITDTSRAENVQLGIALVGVFVVLLALSLGAFLLCRRLASREAPPGICKSCGYDLRGSPSNRCPECGAERG